MKNLGTVLLLLTVFLFIGIDCEKSFQRAPDQKCVDKVKEIILRSLKKNCDPTEQDEFITNFKCSIEFYKIEFDDSQGAITTALKKFFADYCVYVTTFVLKESTESIIGSRTLFLKAMNDLADILTGGRFDDFYNSDEAKVFNKRVNLWLAFTDNVAQNPETAQGELVSYAKGRMIPSLLEGISAFNKK